MKRFFHNLNLLYWSIKTVSDQATRIFFLDGTMAEVLQQSPVIPPSEQMESKETLVCFLDHLLERYLRLLDQYQNLQQSLARLFSKVKMDLAEFSGPIFNLHRVLYHLLKPIFQI